MIAAALQRLAGSRFECAVVQLLLLQLVPWNSKMGRCCYAATLHIVASLLSENLHAGIE
jgi:hypothetical protein